MTEFTVGWAMCFRRMLLAGLTLASFTGCGLKLFEKAPKETPISYSGKGYSCVGEIPERVQDYIDDRLSEAQINQFMQCLQKSFLTFAQLTRGEDRNSYAPEELRRFLESYFIKEHKITDGLLAEFMFVKKVMIGGTLDRITRAELYTAVDILEDIRQEAVRLKPHVRMLNPALVVNEDANGSGPRLSEAYGALRQSIQVFSLRLQKSKADYPLVHFQAFLQEFREFVSWDKHFPNSHSPEDWANFLSVYKELAVSPEDPKVIRVADWVPMLQGLSRWYLSYLQYRVGIKDQPLLGGVGLQNVLYLAQEIFALTEEAVNSQPNKIITFDQLNELTKVMYAMKWIPQNLRLDSVNQTLKVMITRVFGDGSIAPADRHSEGLTLQSVANMRVEFYRWAYVQLNLDAQYGPSSKNSNPDPANVPNIQTMTLIPANVRLKLQSLSSGEWDDFMRIKTELRHRALYRPESVRVNLLPSSQMNSIDFDFTNLSRFNFIRMATSLMFRGYAGDRLARWQWSSGITDVEMQKFYEDFRDLGIDLGYADARTHNSGTRSFIEGNLFTYVSDGLKPKTWGLQGQLTFPEALEFFAFMYSSADWGKDLRQAVNTVCKEQGPIDEFGDKLPMVRRDCVRQVLGDAIAERGFHMPALQGYLHGLSAKDRIEYGSILLNTAYSPVTSNFEWVGSNELCVIAAVTQYAETLMTRFDKANDGVLDNADLEDALNMFNGFIRSAAAASGRGELSEGVARGTLIYILQYKAMPRKPGSSPDASWADSLEAEYKSFVDKLYVGGNVARGYVDAEPTLMLDRLELAKVFQAIIAGIVSTPNTIVAP